MDDGTTLKLCIRCGKDKPRERFHNDRNRYDGKNPYCKDCRRVTEDARTRCTDTILCACGCGTILPAVRCDGQPRRFALGHNYVEHAHFQPKERNARWKGGIATRPLYSRAYLAWRTKVLGRDEWTCRRCGVFNAEGRDLVAHHLRHWAKDVAGRYDPSNGVCLCVDCHRIVHGWKPRYLGPTHRLCACGCGTLIRARDAHKRLRYYVRGHWQKGKRRPQTAIDKAQDTRRAWSPEKRAQVGTKISTTKKALGQGPSRETIEASVVARRGKPSPRRGVKMSDESRAKMSESARHRHAKPIPTVGKDNPA